MASLSFRDRFFSPPVARAVTSPSGILAFGAGAAAGVMAVGVAPVAIPVAAAGGLLAYGIRVALAIPRKGTGARIVVGMADAPAVQARKRDVSKSWDIDELVTFLDAIAPHRLSPAFFLAAHTGMRRGEVLGLKWGAIDFTHQRLSITANVQLLGTKIIVQAPKTRTSRRMIEVGRCQGF